MEDIASVSARHQWVPIESLICIMLSTFLVISICSALYPSHPCDTIRSRHSELNPIKGREAEAVCLLHSSERNCAPLFSRDGEMVDASAGEIIRIYTRLGSWVELATLGHVQGESVRLGDDDGRYDGTTNTKPTCSQCHHRDHRFASPANPQPSLCVAPLTGSMLN